MKRERDEKRDALTVCSRALQVLVARAGQAPTTVCSLCAIIFVQLLSFSFNFVHFCLFSFAFVHFGSFLASFLGPFSQLVQIISYFSFLLRFSSPFPHPLP